VTGVLKLERKDDTVDESRLVTSSNIGILFTPPVGDEDYWVFRVGLNEAQAVVGFPKFGTIGIGFAEEEDWNTNLPYTVSAEKILEHIWHNAGPTVSREQALEAIEMIKAAAHELRGTTLEDEI